MPPGIDTPQVSGIHKSKIIGLVNPSPWGKTLYVRSTHARADDSHNAGTNFLQPLATLAKAISIALIDDLIVVGADHVEDIAAATTMSVANVRIVGEGDGRTKPRISFTTLTTANLKLDAAGIRIENIHFRCGIDSQVDMINVAKANCAIVNCDFSHNSAQALIAISAVAAADDLYVAGCRVDQTDAGAACWLQLVGADRAVVEFNDVQGNYSTATINNVTTAAAELRITNNQLVNENAVGLNVALVSTTRGVVEQGIVSAGTTAFVGGAGERVNPFGRVLYVQSTHGEASDTANAGTRANFPLATIAQAITQSLAGDLILVGPLHVENIAATTALSKNNVTIRGIGSGRNRPAITAITLDSANFAITGTGVTLENLHFIVGVDSLVDAINVAAAGCSIIDCEISDGSGSEQALIAIGVTAAGDDLLIDGFTAHQTVAGPVSCISIVGADRCVIRNCNIQGNYSLANIDNQTTLCSDILISHNVMVNENAVDANIDLHADSTGHIHDNRLEIVTNTELTWIDAGNCTLNENYGVNDDAETGKLIGTVSA